VCTKNTLAANNYDFSFVDGKLTVTKATLTVTADDTSREYGTATGSLSATITGFKNLETLASSGVTGSPSCTSVRTASSPVNGSTGYAIVCTKNTLAATNYDFSFVDGTLTVTKATPTATDGPGRHEYGTPS